MSGLALTGTFAPSLGLARARSRSTTSRARGMTVFAKGKGSRYRNDLADPYQATKTSAEKAAKKAPKQTADRGPINITFDASDDTEEYFLFVRKVRGDGDQDATKDASASSASSSSKAASAEIAAALGMKPNDAVPAVASIGAWLPLGDVVMEAGADLDVVVAERREILTSFAKRKHLKLLPILDDERLEWGARAQRGKSRGSDPTAVFRVADARVREAMMAADLDEDDELTLEDRRAPAAQPPPRRVAAAAGVSLNNTAILNYCDTHQNRSRSPGM